jgi:antitoxin component YwqK of YwqJK toxin-antitoxin module
MEDEYISWNPDGSLDDSGYYRNNMRHGIWIEWIQNGIIKSVGEYRNGWKKGLWRYYDTKGKLLYMRRFSSFKYDEEGEYYPFPRKIDLSIVICNSYTGAAVYFLRLSGISYLASHAHKSNTAILKYPTHS